MIKKLLYIFLLSAINTPVVLHAQSKFTVTGRVTNKEGEPVIGATLYIEALKIGSVSDFNGLYSIEHVVPNTYTLTVSSLGFQTQTHEIHVNTSLELDFQMDEDIHQLQDIVVHSNQEIQKIKATGFNVDVISATPYQDMNLDVNQIMQMSSGINIRQGGGLGSKFNLSLNGLSGNQIRYFLDGVPMENFGSAMTLNNYPANLIRGIEVYKGVVPISLASDALGGSINITTAPLDEHFLDASYSYGSFNTHRASLFAQHSTDGGLFMRLSSFYNHSDNNYWMNHVPVTDDKGNVLGETKARRFNDQYTSGLVSIKTGVIGKTFADELFVDLSYAKNSDNIQHPEVSINRVYGGLNSTEETYLGGIHYAKKWNKLKITTNALVVESTETTYDTLSRRYNWQQEYEDRSDESPLPGERYAQKSIFKVTDRTFRMNSNLRYTLIKGHSLGLSHSHNHMSRDGEDKINPNNLAFSNPNNLSKDMLNVAYYFHTKDDALKTSVFSKKYWYNAEVNAEEYVKDSMINVRTVSNLSKLGYGLTVSYVISESWLTKFSYEKAYRLPLPDEILGDGLFIDPSPGLVPENSHNFNLGAAYNKPIQNSRIKTEATLFYRAAKDFILYINDRGLFGKYDNLANVRILGMESSASLNIDKKYVIGFNWTYQNITDRTKKDEGFENTNYGEKIPNTPYFFWNVHLAYNLHFDTMSKMSFSWSSRYIHSFYLYWAESGSEETKHKIPTQFINNLDINYSFGEGKYNVSASVKNLFNAEAYDNFNIQKPGRAFYIKIRYFISQF